VRFVLILTGIENRLIKKNYYKKKGEIVCEMNCANKWKVKWTYDKSAKQMGYKIYT